MNGHQDASELIVGAQRHLTRADELIYRVHGVPSLSQILYGKESLNDVTPTEILAYQSRMGTELSERLKSVHSESGDASVRRETVLDILDSGSEHELLRKQAEFAKGDPVLRRLKDLKLALHGELAKVKQVSGHAVMDEKQRQEVDALDFKNGERFVRPVGMTDEQVREFADQLGLAAEKAGEAGAFMPRERLDEIQRALEVFREEFLGTVE